MEKTLNLILRTYSSNPDFNGECDFALVRLTPQEIQTIRERVALAKSLQEEHISFASIDFWDYSAQYFQWWEDLEELIDYKTLDGGVPVRVNDSVVGQIPESVYQRTEADRMIVFSDCIYWECRPKYSEYVTIETAELVVSDLSGKGRRR